MDQRIIVTTPVLLSLAFFGLFGVAQSMVDAPLTQGQPAFLAIVGVFGPLAAIGLIWARNYAYGAPALVASTVATAWFVTYFFFIHDNPANVFAVTGDATTAYLASTAGLVVALLFTAVGGCWLWYRESPGFRSMVDRLAGPSDI